MVALVIIVVASASDFTYSDRYSKISSFETGICRTAEAIGSLASSNLAITMHSNTCVAKRRIGSSILTLLLKTLHSKQVSDIRLI